MLPATSYPINFGFGHIADSPFGSQESTVQASDPAVERRAVVQVDGAHIVRWRGAFGIHPWIAVKRAGVDHYTTITSSAGGLAEAAMP